VSRPHEVSDAVRPDQATGAHRRSRCWTGPNGIFAQSGFRRSQGWRDVVRSQDCEVPRAYRRSHERPGDNDRQAQSEKSRAQGAHDATRAGRRTAPEECRRSQVRLGHKDLATPHHEPSRERPQRNGGAVIEVQVSEAMRRSTRTTPPILRDIDRPPRVADGGGSQSPQGRREDTTPPRPRARRRVRSSTDTETT
jgi:hypothetical protein